MTNQAEFKITDRAHVYLGRVYLLRDTWVNGRLLCVEYGVRDDDGSILWEKTVEGVEFKDIQPVVAFDEMLTSIVGNVPNEYITAAEKRLVDELNG